MHLHHQILCVIIFVSLTQTYSLPNELNTIDESAIAKPENGHNAKTVKKDLEKEIKPPETTLKTNSDSKVENEKIKPIVTPEQHDEKPKEEIATQPKDKNETDQKSPHVSANDNKSSPKPLPSDSHIYHQEEVIMQSNEEISDSLKTGFYFFVALSLSAILFIVFKVYRLRLSRAERKYGVQGDRTTQELTPLPIGIEDGHSDDEDQTVFEVNRQNIRIL
ncbi:uncharacterized protein LOC106093880 [Stomoxys calcitrans]|uniref:Uncharacterized protein n=1 Tax=Stomoxys calcitrans TaxID=35570 RepID=A0A1I8NM25_STOCA|nr:uncharacterized protein LOC106093880 [Stomoxys calcitrans]